MSNKRSIFSYAAGLLLTGSALMAFSDSIASAQSGTRIVPNRGSTRSGQNIRGRGAINNYGTSNQGSGSSTQSGSSTRTFGNLSSAGLNGYCPVCIVKSKKWVKGNPNFSSQFDGFTYYFPNAKIKTEFEASPSAFVPVMAGIDVVSKRDNNDSLIGSIFTGAVLHKGRVFLFSSKANKAKFLATAANYENVDLAFGGMCAVCKASGKEHAGKPEFKYVHNKLTYLFPSEAELAEFKKTPTKYAQK